MDWVGISKLQTVWSQLLQRETPKRWLWSQSYSAWNHQEMVINKRLSWKYGIQVGGNESEITTLK